MPCGAGSGDKYQMRNHGLILQEITQPKLLQRFDGYNMQM
jgi:hypothetical protein